MALRFSRESNPSALVVQSIRMAAGLTLLKFVAGIATGSLSVMSSALDSLLDITASAVNYVSLTVSHRPPDSAHPYGHGKAEALAGLFQGAFIAAGGLALLVECVRRVHDFRLAGVDVGGIALVAMLVSIIASTLHSFKLKQAARATGSTVMETECAHFSMDVLANGAIIGALIAVRVTGSPIADIVISVFITVYILRKAAKILIDCSQDLMDRSLSLDLSAKITGIIATHHPRISGFHNLRARRSGGQTFIDFHIEIRKVESFREAHDITESLIDRVKGLVPGADVVVHYDPEGER